MGDGGEGTVVPPFPMALEKEAEYVEIVVDEVEEGRLDMEQDALEGASENDDPIDAKSVTNDGVVGDASTVVSLVDPLPGLLRAERGGYASDVRSKENRSVKGVLGTAAATEAAASAPRSEWR